MAAVKLNKRVVDALAATNRTKVHYDPELKGFGVRITPTGYKAWIVEYRPGGGGRNA